MTKTTDNSLIAILNKKEIIKKESAIVTRGLEQIKVIETTKDKKYDDSELEEVDQDLLELLNNKEMEISKNEKNFIESFLNEVNITKPANLNQKSEIFKDCLQNRNVEQRNALWISVNIRLLFNILMRLIKYSYCFKYIKQFRGEVVKISKVQTDDFFLIQDGKDMILTILDCLNNFDISIIYKLIQNHFHHNVQRIYSSYGLSFKHTLNAEYFYKDSCIYLKNNDNFDWENVFCEIWYKDLKPIHRYFTYYPIFHEKGTLEPGQKIKLINLSNKINKKQNPIIAICLWCENSKRIYHHRALNISYSKNISQLYPVFANDWDRGNSGCWPTIAF